MNLEFSLTELLERLVPGTIFISVLSFMFGFDIQNLLGDGSKVSLVLVAFSVAYSIGTLLNIVAGWAISDQRTYWSLEGKHIPAIKVAVEDYFKVAADDDAWKLCYGVVHKNDYSVKSELFTRPNVFCKSMSICGSVSV